MEAIALHRREALVLTAIEVIHDLGLQGLSVREVAKRQGISNASIFSHFRSKHELMLAVLDHFSQYDEALRQAVQQQKGSSLEAIRSFVESYFAYYENYPEISSLVMSLEGLHKEEPLTERVVGILNRRLQTLEQLIAMAQQTGELRAEPEAFRLVEMILGACNLILLKWRLQGYAFPLKERVSGTLVSILQAFAADQATGERKA